MAKRKRAAQIATDSASGFQTSPTLRSAEALGNQAFGTLGQLLGYGGGGGQAGQGAGGGSLEDRFSSFGLGAGRDQVLDFIRQREAGGATGALSPAEIAEVERRFGQGAGQNLNTVLEEEARRRASAGGGTAQGGGADPLRSFMDSPLFRERVQAGQSALASNAALAGQLGSGMTARRAISLGQAEAGQNLGQYLDLATGAAQLGAGVAGQRAGAEQAAQMGASGAWMQPGALGKAFGALTTPFNAAGETFAGRIFQ